MNKNKDNLGFHLISSGDGKWSCEFLWKGKSFIHISTSELMKLEKERLGFQEHELVFVGMANLANYYWCGWQSYLKSKEQEETFFDAYFGDRLNRSQQIKPFKKKPTIHEILSCGDCITTEYLDKELAGIDTPSLTKEMKNYAKRGLKKKQVTALDRGSHIQTLKAEKYPSQRRSYQYKSLIILGVPDGITDDFVYEFKSTSKNAYIQQTLTRAVAQADLYGYFFKRKKRRVQVHCLADDKIYTYDDLVRVEKAEELLNKWISMKAGMLPEKPQAYKCSVCPYNKSCVIIGTKMN